MFDVSDRFTKEMDRGHRVDGLIRNVFDANCGKGKSTQQE